MEFLKHLIGDEADVISETLYTEYKPNKLPKSTNVSSFSEFTRNNVFFTSIKSALKPVSEASNRSTESDGTYTMPTSKPRNKALHDIMTTRRGGPITSAVSKQGTRKEKYKPKYHVIEDEETSKVRVYLTVDPETGRALYDDESKFMGVFDSVLDAAKQLGDDVLSFCNIKPAKPPMREAVDEDSAKDDPNMMYFSYTAWRNGTMVKQGFTKALTMHDAKKGIMRIEPGASVETKPITKVQYYSHVLDRSRK